MDKVVKIFLILSVIGGFIGIIIYLRQPSRWAGFQKEHSFISSKTWVGKKEGYVFTRGDKGQGYYKDKLNK